MQSPDRHDWNLVRRYARTGSQAAFDEIVNRHLKMVYGVCRREIGNACLAEDATQVVFIILSRKAGRLLPGTIVARWLFKTAVFASRDIVRRETRRLAREMTASTMSSAMLVDPLANRPLETALNAALSALNASDWEAVHLRFYEELSLREIGELWGTSEDTAQKRVSRALTPMRKTISTAGIGLTAASIVALLTTEAARSATERCFESVLQGSTIPLIAAPAAISTLAKGVIRAMLIKNLAIATGIAVIGLTGTAVAVRSAGSATGRASTKTIAAIPSTVKTPSAAMPVVIVDPGHGGEDAGATVDGIHEKDLNLAIAMKVKRRFEADGWLVRMTRTSDVNLSVDERAHLSQSVHPVCFISIHCDEMGKEDTHEGSAVYFHPDRTADYKLAQSVSSGLMGTRVFANSAVHSDSLRFKAGFGVLRENTAPAVLVECAYMTNASDLSKLETLSDQDKIARGIVDGVVSDARSTSASSK